MRWSNFETPEGQIISIDMDELVAVINYPGDRADLCLKNGTLHTVIFMGQWKTEDKYQATPLPDYDPEILRSEIQDLKLENDRLQQREKIIIPFINALACNKTILTCEGCKYHSINGCKFSDLYSGSPICKEAEFIIKKLEDL